jgi:CheY-like chemotaxis protein
LRALRILIADGFVDFLDMMEHILRARGHEPLAAPTENGALEACTLFAPDVLLFDPNLVSDVPSFLETARKRMPAGSRIVALVIDGELRDNLVDGLLRKPIKLDDLFALFERWFD